MTIFRAFGGKPVICSLTREFTIFDYLCTLTITVLGLGGFATIYPIKKN
jgi:hypothetical protein